jgi:hypothetical protein
VDFARDALLLVEKNEYRSFPAPGLRRVFRIVPAPEPEESGRRSPEESARPEKDDIWGCVELPRIVRRIEKEASPRVEELTRLKLLEESLPFDMVRRREFGNLVEAPFVVLIWNGAPRDTGRFLPLLAFVEMVCVSRG